MARISKIADSEPVLSKLPNGNLPVRNCRCCRCDRACTWGVSLRDLSACRPYHSKSSQTEATDHTPIFHARRSLCMLERSGFCIDLACSPSLYRGDVCTTHVFETFRAQHLAESIHMNWLPHQLDAFHLPMWWHHNHIRRSRQRDHHDLPHVAEHVTAQIGAQLGLGVWS